MILADLHLHSIYSDGFHTPLELIYLAKKKNLKYISITDHNWIGSYQFLSTDINIVDGVEISTIYKGISVHLLGYSRNFKDINQFNFQLESIRKGYIDRLEKIISKVEEEFKTKLSIPEEYKKSKNHFARFCLNQGIDPDYIKSVKIEEENFFINLVDAINLIHKHNGMAFIAHPGQILKKLSYEQFENIFSDIVYLLDGIVVYHPKNIDHIEFFLKYASKYDLKITGGSDFHSILDSVQNIVGDFGISDINKDLHWIL